MVWSRGFRMRAIRIASVYPTAKSTHLYSLVGNLPVRLPDGIGIVQPLRPSRL